MLASYINIIVFKVRYNMEAERLRQPKVTLSDSDTTMFRFFRGKSKADSCMENFYLFPTVLKVYQAVRSDTLPSEVDVHLLNRKIKRKIYQLVFDTLYRKLAIS